MFFVPCTKAAQQTVQCAALIAPYVSSSIRWGGVAERHVSPKQHKRRSAPRFFLCPRFISPHVFLARPDCLLTHYQHSCFPHQAGQKRPSSFIPRRLPSMNRLFAGLAPVIAAEFAILLDDSVAGDHQGDGVGPHRLTIPSYERGVARLLRYDRHP